MRSFNDVVLFTQLVDPVVSASTTDVESDSVDTKNFGITRLLVLLGATGDTLSGSVKLELEVEESDDDSSFTDVADEYLSNTVDGTNDGTFAVVDANTEDERIYDVEYRGKKRYVRVVVNKTGTHTNGIPLAVLAVQGAAAVAPVA